MGVTALDVDVDRSSQPEPGSLLTRVPGRARSRAEVLKEFEEGVADLRRRMKPAFWSRFVGLPVGEYWCHGDHDTAKPYRDIIEWREKKVREFPPDPEEPQHGLDPETWAEIRHAESRSSAFWTVKLSCGHFTDCCVLDVEWEPDDGPKLVTKKRLAEMRRDFEEYWAADGATGWPEEGPERDHIRKMLDLGWPQPEPEKDCYACTRAKRFSGYQRIGWLVPKPKQSPPPLTERQMMENQLAKAEAEVQRLRRKLERDA